MSSVDVEVMNQAKKAGLNVSDVLEKALREKFVSKKNFPEKNLAVKCSHCSKEINEGFWCRQNQLVLCRDCQKSYDMTKCRHDMHGEHYHYFWPPQISTAQDVVDEVNDAK